MWWYGVLSAAEARAWSAPPARPRTPWPPLQDEVFKLISGSVSAGTLWKTDWLRQPLPATLARRLGPGPALTKLKPKATATAAAAPVAAAAAPSRAAPGATPREMPALRAAAPAPAPAPGSQWPPAAETWTTRALDLARPGPEAEAVQVRKGWAEAGRSGVGVGLLRTPLAHPLPPSPRPAAAAAEGGLRHHQPGRAVWHALEQGLGCRAAAADAGQARAGGGDARATGGGCGSRRGRGRHRGAERQRRRESLRRRWCAVGLCDAGRLRATGQPGRGRRIQEEGGQGSSSSSSLLVLVVLWRRRLGCGARCEPCQGVQAAALARRQRWHSSCSR